MGQFPGCSPVVPMVWAPSPTSILRGPWSLTLLKPLVVVIVPGLVHEDSIRSPVRTLLFPLQNMGHCVHMCGVWPYTHKHCWARLPSSWPWAYIGHLFWVIPTALQAVHFWGGTTRHMAQPSSPGLPATQVTATPEDTAPLFLLLPRWSISQGRVTPGGPRPSSSLQLVPQTCMSPAQPGPHLPASSSFHSSHPICRGSNTHTNTRGVRSVCVTGVPENKLTCYFQVFTQDKSEAAYPKLRLDSFLVKLS